MAYDINANRGGSVIACAIVFLVLCSVAVALRFISHRAMRRPIFVEDWMIIPAWIMMMGLCANLICSESMIHAALNTRHLIADIGRLYPRRCVRVCG